MSLSSSSWSILSFVFSSRQANLLSGHPELATTVMNFQSSSLPKKSGLTIIKSLLAQQTNTFLCGNAALALGLCIKDKKEAIPLIMGKEGDETYSAATSFKPVIIIVMILLHDSRTHSLDLMAHTFCALVTEKCLVLTLILLVLDAVDPLISLLRTEKMKVVHQNAAICLARMSAHPPVIAILREKRAMELMYGTLGNNMKK